MNERWVHEVEAIAHGGRQVAGLLALLLLPLLVAGLLALGGQVGRWTDERMYAGAGAATLRDMREGQGRPGTSLLGDSISNEALRNLYVGLGSGFFYGASGNIPLLFRQN